MKFKFLWGTLAWSATLVGADSAFALEERDKPLPPALRKTVSYPVLRSVTASVGPRGASCWLVWTKIGGSAVRPGDKIRLSVWMPTGKQRWREIARWRLSDGESNPDFWNNANVEWLNVQKREGLVLIVPRGKTTQVLALRPNLKRQRNSRETYARHEIWAISDEFTEAATSIYATNYRIGDTDERGFFGVTEVYSEPGVDGDGNTITQEKPLRWNGNGWSVSP